MVNERKSCRWCDGDLANVLELGDQAVVDFPKIGDSSSRPTAPLTLAQCTRCNLVQLRHTVSPDLLYPTFWYRSGINPMMREALADVVRGIKEHVDLTPQQGRKSDAILDIGCNDGTLLELFDAPYCKVGIDPASNIVNEAADKADLVINDYFSFQAVRSRTARRFKVITAIAMFYDLDDPHPFVRDVSSLLDPDGLFVIQMNYLSTMLSQNAFDNISHEHLEYYSLSTLIPLLDQYGLTVVDVEQNDVNGGSIRVYAKPFMNDRGETPAVFNRVSDMLATEKEDKLNDPQTIQKFSWCIKSIAHRLNTFLEEEAPRPIYLYGASTRGTVLMQYLDSLSPVGSAVRIAGAAERDERKYGREMAGTGIPIVPEDEARAKAKTFLVLPWHFWPAIVQREAEWINKGGLFVKPLPNPIVINRDGGWDL